MSMGFRSGKYKKIFIILLLILSILSQQLVCLADVKDIFEGAVDATPDTSKYVAKTYYDFMNSVAESCGYTMEEILDPDVDDSLDYKDYGKASFVRFVNWYTNVYSDEHNGGDIDTIDFLKNELDQCTLFGFKMSQKLWDAFKQFFDEVANDVPYGESAFDQYDVDSLRQYISAATGGEVPANFYVYNYHESDLVNFLNPTNIIVKMSDTNSNSYSYYLFCPMSEDATFFNTSWSASSGDGYFGWKIKDSSTGYWVGASYILSFYGSDTGSARYYSSSFNYVGQNTTIQVLAQNGHIIKGTASQLFSPYIKYTPTGSAPTQVPDIIPWSTFPGHEVTDDDTKIYIPTDTTDDPGQSSETPEDPTETPEQPTETPEDPTETPGDSDDGDDITNLVPIFPDIDIDFDIHLPDDWVNPPGIDLDPDVDIDTPSPGGKIPHLQKLKEKFPFCIPFDLVLLFKMLNKKPKAPKWEFKHEFKLSDSYTYTFEIVIDMAEYEEYVQAFREGFFILFLVGLFFVTKKLVSWQTG